MHEISFSYVVVKVSEWTDNGWNNAIKFTRWQHCAMQRGARLDFQFVFVSLLTPRMCTRRFSTLCETYTNIYPAVSSLGINEHTRRACDAPVNSRRLCVSGGRGSRVEQSADRCHLVAIAVDIQETAEDRTVCSELYIAPPRLTHCFFTARAARTSCRFSSFLFCKVS